MFTCSGLGEEHKVPDFTRTAAVIVNESIKDNASRASGIRPFVLFPIRCM